MTVLKARGSNVPSLAVKHEGRFLRVVSAGWVRGRFVYRLEGGVMVDATPETEVRE